MQKNKLRIAILGTKGIPNNFGGFEQCAEKLGLSAAAKGHEVTVYNPIDHFYKEETWNSIKIKRIYSNEKRFNFFNSFIIDYLSLSDAVKCNYDVILELGYSPCALFYYLKKSNTKAKIITNMAGMEWKRSKWNTLAQKTIKLSEKLAVKYSDILISDNPGIKNYYWREYGENSIYIPYGAELFDSPEKKYLEKYDVKEYSYYMQVARFQPDNNFGMVLDGYLKSGSIEPFLVVGNHSNDYGVYLKKKYKNMKSIKFLGGIYDYNVLSSLRWFSKLYFHGHSCGGTNPSLLEAMASSAYISAYSNGFNNTILGEHAFYFKDSEEVANLISYFTKKYRKAFVSENREKIRDIYNWEMVSEQYLNVFQDVCHC
jgi:glycosyltransferase involved in cell wall biosynthesis